MYLRKKNYIQILWMALFVGFKIRGHYIHTESCYVATLNVKTTLNVKNSYTKGKFLH